DHAAPAHLADHHVPGQEEGDVTVHLERPAGELRVAGREHVGPLGGGASARAEHLVEVELVEDPEALLHQGLPGGPNRLVEGHRGDGLDRDIHGTSLPRPRVRGQARDKNSFSSSSTVSPSSPVSPSRAAHSRILVLMILKPARSSALDTAASWVTTSLQFLSCSTMSITAQSCPRARRSRLRTC